MGDFSKCSGTGCPMKEDCYRYLAASFTDCQGFIDPPFDEQTGKCTMFWNVITLGRKKKLLGLKARAIEEHNAKEMTVGTNEQQNKQEGSKE